MDLNTVHAEDSYASLIWQKRYIKRNYTGFRDENFSNKNIEKKALVFLGDSFTFGFGIKNPNDRYSNIVGNQLDKKYEFYNLGMVGTGIPEQLSCLDIAKNTNKILILQVFINDISDYYQIDVGPDPELYGNYSKIDKYIVRSMFFLNYAYFMIPNKKLFNLFYHQIKVGFSDDNTIKNYLVGLTGMINEAKYKYNYSDIVVVIMPILPDVNLSNDFEYSIVNELKKYNYVRTIQISSLVPDLDVKDRIINKNDIHASETVNLRIANKLLQIL